MITCRVYRDGELQDEAPYDLDVVRSARARGHRLWLDAVDPDDGELERLGVDLGLHELAVEDSRRWGQRAKVELYPEHLFLVVHGVDRDESGELVDREVHLFATPARDDLVVTIRRTPRFDLAKVGTRLRASPELSREGIGFLLYLVLDEVVDGYLDLVERFEDLADDIEDAVAVEDDSGPEGSRALGRRIFELRTQVVRFRRLAAPMREAVDMLLESPSVTTPALAPYLRDVLDHVIRTMELSDNVRDLLTSARELQLAQASNRLNVVMKQLSAWAAIILIPTLIAGVYGMNFRHIPELGWAFGYPFALGLMVVAALALYLTFRRRDWL